MDSRQHDKCFEIKAIMQEIRNIWKIVFSDEDKRRDEKEVRPDDQDDENMGINDKEQNIEEVDIGLQTWIMNLQWSDDQNLLLFTFLCLSSLSLA